MTIAAHHAKFGNSSILQQLSQPALSAKGLKTIHHYLYHCKAVSPNISSIPNKITIISSNLTIHHHHPILPITIARPQSIKTKDYLRRY